MTGTSFIPIGHKIVSPQMATVLITLLTSQQMTIFKTEPKYYDAYRSSQQTTIQ
jgi:hypothetical protein